MIDVRKRSKPVVFEFEEVLGVIERLTSEDGACWGESTKRQSSFSVPRRDQRTSAVLVCLFVLRFILTPLRSSPPFHAGHPSRWPTTPFPATLSHAFQNEDRLFDSFVFRFQLHQHLVYVHRFHDRTCLVLSTAVATKVKPFPSP